MESGKGKPNQGLQPSPNPQHDRKSRGEAEKLLCCSGNGDGVMVTAWVFGKITFDPFGVACSPNLRTRYVLFVGRPYGFLAI